MAFEVGATLLIVGLASSAAATTRASEGIQLQAESEVPAPPTAREDVPGTAPATAPSQEEPRASEEEDEEEGAESEDQKTDDSAASPAPASPSPASPSPAPPSPAPPSPAPAAAPDAASMESAASSSGEAPTSDAASMESVASSSGEAPTSDVASGAAAASAAAAASPPAAQPAPEPAPAIPAEGSGFQVGLSTDASKHQPGKDQGATSKSPVNALPPGQILVPGGFSIAIGTQMSFGQSTFQLGSEYARDPMVDWSVSLTPSYFFGDGTRIAASASLSQELTDANGDDEPGTIILSDVGLTLSRPLYRFEKGPTIFGALSLQLPASTASRVETLVMSTGARVSAAQPVGPVFLSLGTGFRKNFHRYTNPTRDPFTGEQLVTRDGLVIDEVVTGLARINGSELAGATYFESETNNTSMIWSNSLSAFWPATAKLGLGIAYNLSHSWTYESIPLDEFSGVGARGGRGRRDSHGGTLFANYQAFEHLAFGLGMATGGPTRTADDKRIRFPFFNLEGPESNMTTFFISATYTESIPL